MKIRKKTNENIYVSEDQVVDRSAWVCGGSSELLAEALGPSGLLNEKGFMCCLGHVCHNSGFGKDQLLDRGFPSELLNKGDFLDIPGLAYIDTWNCGTDSDFVETAVDINDSTTLSPKEREKELKALFKEHGMKLKFVGKYPAAVRAYNKEKFGE